MNAPTTAGPDVVTIGETLALFAALRPGPLLTGAPFEFRIGGSESNVAVGLARLGTSVAWVGRLGDDAFGDAVVRALRGEGVDVRAVRDPSLRTGLMVKERRTPLHQRVTYSRTGSAGSALCMGDIDDRLIGAARVLHVTGITPALSDSAADAVTHAVTVARDAGVLVSLDVNYRAGLWSRERAGHRLRELLPAVDLLFTGLDEAELMTGPATPVDARHAGGAGDEPAVTARALAELGPHEVVVTHGATGATSLVDGEVRSVVPPVVPVVDTVGAGDAFVAGYLAGLLTGAPAARRLELACRTGAFACTVHGDWEGAPTRTDLTLLDVGDPVLR